MKLLILVSVLVSYACSYPTGVAVNAPPALVPDQDDFHDALEDAIERYLDPKGTLGVDVDFVDHNDSLDDLDDVYELDFDDHIDDDDRYKLHLVPVVTPTGQNAVQLVKAGHKYRIRRPPIGGPATQYHWPKYTVGPGFQPKFEIVGVNPALSTRKSAQTQVGPKGGAPAAVPVRYDDDLDDIREDIVDKIEDAREDLIEKQLGVHEDVIDAQKDAIERQHDAIEDAHDAHEDAVEDHIEVQEDLIEARNRAPAAAPAATKQAVAAKVNREFSEDVAEVNRDLADAQRELQEDLADPSKTAVEAHQEYLEEVADAKKDLQEDAQEHAQKSAAIASAVV